MPSPHIPDFIEGKMGYYCLAAETSISNGTAEAAWASLDVALSGAEHILSGLANEKIFNRCRRPHICVCPWHNCLELNIKGFADHNDKWSSRFGFGQYVRTLYE